jgi:hypothetical protein
MSRRRAALLAISCLLALQLACGAEPIDGGVSHPIKHGPVVRSIVPDILLALANEFAAAGVGRVLALDKSPGCQGKIAPLVSLSIDARCVASLDEARAAVHANDSSAQRAPPIAIIVDADNDYHLLPTLFWLSRRHQTRLLVTSGTFTQGAGEGPVTSQFASVSNATGHIVKLFFKASPVFRDSFNRIYSAANWGDGAAAGDGSGPGSSLNYTKNTRVPAHASSLAILRWLVRIRQLGGA